MDISDILKRDIEIELKEIEEEIIKEPVHHEQVTKYIKALLLYENWIRQKNR